MRFKSAPTQSSNIRIQLASQHGMPGKQISIRLPGMVVVGENFSFQ
jgi:hypothetical protein